MYPFFRSAYAMARMRKLPKISPFESASVFTHIMPWDLDPFMELNNGRTLTLYDIGRFAWGARCGMNEAYRDHGYGITVAGAMVRYRKRVTVFQRIEISAQCVGMDDRFFYVVQNMKRGDEFVGQSLLRKAVLRDRKMVAPTEMLVSLGYDVDDVPELPDWVRSWRDAEDLRPWPPEEKI